MSFSQAQPVVVTLIADNNLRPVVLPAVNVQTAQQAGVTRVGDNQTVIVSPAA